MGRVQVTMLDKLVPNESVAAAFTGITAGVGVAKGFRVERPDSSTLVIVHRYCPTWAVVCGIVGLFVFLLGLLFFAVKTEDRATIVGRDVDGGARFTVTGQTDSQIAGFLADFLKPAD